VKTSDRDVTVEAKQRTIETLQFMLSHTQELLGLAKGERCPMIAYLLEMALIEIGDEMRKRRDALKKEIPSQADMDEVERQEVKRIFAAADALAA
jgi:hypothetical protein